MWRLTILLRVLGLCGRLSEQPSKTERLFRLRIWAVIPLLGLNRFSNGKDIPNPSIDSKVGRAQDLIELAPKDELTYFPVTGNLLPNTKWQVMTTFGNGQKRNSSGTGLMPFINVSRYTTGANTVTCYTSNTGELKVGDLVIFSASVDTNMRICSMRVDSLESNVSFTGGLPLGLKPKSSAACTAMPTMSGGTPSIGTGGGPDGWDKALSMQVWRDDHAVNNKPGSKYQLGVEKGANSEESLLHQIPANDIDQYRGRTIVFGTWVYQKLKQGAGTWSVFIRTNGMGGGLARNVDATGNGYEWKEVSKAIPADCTYIQVGVMFTGNKSDVYYVSQPVLDYGSIIGRGNYRPPIGEQLIPKVKMSPLSYIGAAISPGREANSAGDYGFELRLYPETNGVIAPTVKTLSMMLEARCDTLNRALGIRNQAQVPHIYGLLMYSKVAGMMETYHGELTLNARGDAYVYCSHAGDAWYNASIDINGYRLS